MKELEDPPDTDSSLADGDGIIAEFSGTQM